jgi:hypothetical protein
MNATGQFQKTPDRHRALFRAAALGLAWAIALACSPACAESAIAPSGARSAAAHLDFRIVIPRVLRLDASEGKILTNARASETVVIATSDPGTRYAVASRSAASSIRGAIDALTRGVPGGPTSYTVAMP